MTYHHLKYLHICWVGSDSLRNLMEKQPYSNISSWDVTNGYKSFKYISRRLFNPNYASRM